MICFYPPMKKDRTICKKKDGRKGPLFTPRGQAILWSANKDFCKAETWQDALKNDQIKKIAIANTQTAPYGAAAKKALEKAGMWDALQSKLVNAQDIAQSFQYASHQRLMPDSARCRPRSALKGKKAVSMLSVKRRKLFSRPAVEKNNKSRCGGEVRGIS